MTSMAQHDETELGGPWSILTRQKRDHVRLDALLHRLHRTSGTEQDRLGPLRRGERAATARDRRAATRRASSRAPVRAGWPSR